MGADPPPDPADPFARIQALLAEFLSRRQAGEPLDLAALEREHPAEAELMRELHADWLHARESASGAHPAAGSLGARLQGKYGTSADLAPARDTSPKPSSADSATSDLVRRLSEHAPATPRYKLEGEVARGGMGAILKVWDEDLRRHLAMKIVLGRSGPSSSAENQLVDDQRLARFLEEAQVTGQLDHPGVVPVHELGLDQDGRVFFTMKLVKGRDLRAIYELVFEGREGWNEARALSILLKACEAVAYAHKKGVIHRDLKPANVMVGDFGEVFVMDWGLARVMGSADRHDIRIAPVGASSQSVRTERRTEREETPDSPIVTMDGDVVGTPAYMPPEQARGEVEKLSPRSDVYAFGAMLYHLLARQMPYVPPGSRVGNRTVLGLVINGPPAPISSLRRDVPQELVAICEKAMARDAGQRYADTLALAEDLRAYLERRVVKAYEMGPWAEARKWVERNKPLATALAAAVVILIVGIVTSLTYATRASTKTEEAKREATTAERARQEAAAKSAELQSTNTALDAAKLSAEANERIAIQKANDVLSLSAIQELKELVERADILWPALPSTMDAYDRWLEQAKVLIDGRPADPSKGLERHPSLKDHEAKLAEIRQRAVPLTSEQIEADRRASPSFADWEMASAKVTWMRRMLGTEPWPREADIAAALAKESLPADAQSLGEIAWSLLSGREGHVMYCGNEIKALLLAKRAVEVADESERSHVRSTLAWALCRCGRLEEALTEEQRAVSEAKDDFKEDILASLKAMQVEVLLWKTPDSRTKQTDAAAQLAARAAELERDANKRRTYEFNDAQDRWWHAQLSQLVLDLKKFADEKTGLYSEGMSEQHGWGILKRRKEAATIEDRSVNGVEARRRWDEATASIAKSQKYGGLRLEPQLGLLPVGEDPDSHLWEFAHLQTGDVPERDGDGKLLRKSSMGIVLVLIPSGSFWMGAQRTDPSGRNYDPQAADNESPPHEVNLDAYFISKYELTQGQWLRLEGQNPSSFGSSNYYPSWNREGRPWSALHPVEQVSWTDCTKLMQRMSMLLPTEAQWECACRAGTRRAYSSGDQAETLREVANVADAFAKAHGGGGWGVLHEAWDDGNTAHAEVGSYRANGFGLHDMHGNVWEWCRDGYGGYGLPLHPGDGERQATDTSNRVDRGGSFAQVASSARSALRFHRSPGVRSENTGLRPARGITP